MIDVKRNYVLLTGSDLGDRLSNLHLASSHIHEQAGKVLRKSSIYESEPWGFSSATRFLNQAVLIVSEYDPEKLLSIILQIEERMGRTRVESGYTSRFIDIDIICSDSLIHESELLSVPHPKMHLREFVLNPVDELVPDWKHPVFNRTCAEMKLLIQNESIKPHRNQG